MPPTVSPVSEGEPAESRRSHMAVYILYPTKRFVANVPPVNFFRAFVRLSFVRRSFATIFPLARNFFRRRENF